MHMNLNNIKTLVSVIQYENFQFDSCNNLRLKMLKVVNTER